jgi:hypothetical protein
LLIVLEAEESKSMVLTFACYLVRAFVLHQNMVEGIT